MIAEARPESTPQPRENNRAWKKLAVLAAVLVVGLIAHNQFGHLLSLEALAEKETQLKLYQQQHPVLVYGIAFMVYVMATGLSLPGAAILTLFYGWYFDLVPGVILVSFASTAGATLAFLLSRFLFRDAIQNKFGDRLASFNQALQREGPFYLFTLRLIPAVPFFLINILMGLTPIKTWTYWWVSQIGMLPGTIVYVFAGSTVPDLKTLARDGFSLPLTTWAAFIFLGAFPFIVRRLMKRFGPPATASSKGTA
jgi:uncharacterized membrane protein YdjX (TVP38/TMEM64 family)